MTVKECYNQIGADYDDAYRRFLTDERILRFLKMLYKDTTYFTLGTALEAGDYEAAFRAVHTLKGVAMNLSLTRLADVSSELTEVLRDGTDNDKIKPLADNLQEAYVDMCQAVGELL